MIAGILDLIPTVGATIAGIVIGIVALSVSLPALIAFAIVIVVYEQIENYILQPTIIGKATQVSAVHRPGQQRAGVRARSSRLIGAIMQCGCAAGRRRAGHRRQELTAPRRARIAAAESQRLASPSRKACDDG